MNLWEFQEVHDHLERILGLIPTRHVGKSHLGVILPGKAVAGCDSTQSVYLFRAWLITCSECC